MNHTMTNKYLMVLAMASLAACGGKQSANVTNTVEEENFHDAYRDSTIYGFCIDTTPAGRLQIITDGGDTLTLDMAEAREKNKVFGGFEKGDEIAIVPNVDSTKAVAVVNKTALLGEWVMTNPMDGSSETGISILRGGSAESIDQSSIVYKSWRLYNGKLQLTSTRDDGIDMDETDEFEIKRLTPDSLVIFNDEEIFEYYRQSASGGNHSIQNLGETGQDDFIM